MIDNTNEIPQLLREIKVGMGTLELISHGPTVNLDKAGAASTVEHPGGKKPGTGDAEYPVGLLERMDARASYQGKTVTYYRRELAGLLAAERDDDWLISKLTELRNDLTKTIEAWKIAPKRSDGSKRTMADWDWKRYIATCGRTVDSLVSEFGCSRQYIKKVQAYEWSAMNLSPEEIERRERQAWLRRRSAPAW